MSNLRLNGIRGSSLRVGGFLASDGNGGGGVFNMLDYSPEAWVDYGDSDVIFEDVDAVDPAVNNGKVARVDDKSVNGYIFKALVNTTRPYYKSAHADAGDQPAVYTPSSNTKGHKSTVAFSAKEVFVVTAYKDGVDATFDRDAYLLSGSSSNSAHLVRGDSYTPNWDDFTSDQSTHLISINGASKSEAALPLPLSVLHIEMDNAHDQTWEIGAATVFGDKSWGSAICEVVFFDRVLTSGERSEIIAGLAAKWGVTIP